MKSSHRDLVKELDFKASRSSGKGGQHVNKTESRVSLFFDVVNSVILTDEEKERLKSSKLVSLSSSGILQIDTEKYRSQLKNKKLAIDKFYSLLSEALKKPKLRKATKPSKAAIKKRLKEKKILSEKKKNRRNDF